MKAEANNGAPTADAIRALTREELAEVLKISVRTVDAMVGAGEIPHLRMRGNLVRFYLPDVVRHLTATAVTRKNGRKAVMERESEERQSVERGTAAASYPRRAG